MKPRKRVLIDVFYLHVAQTGIKTYILSICEEVKKNANSDLEYIISPDFESVSQSTFFRGKTPKWKNLLFQLLYLFRKQLILPLLSFWHQADLIFSPDILSPMWGRGKKVSVIHDTFFWDNPEHYQKIWLKYFLYFLKKGLQKNASVVTITEFSKSRLQNMNEFKDLRIDVAYPSSGLRNNVDNSLKSYSKSPERYFLHVGVLEIRKNLSMLIKAFSELIHIPEYADFKLFLVGQRGPRETLDDYDNLIALVKKYKLEEQVIFPGYVSQGQLSTYFQNALAYIFPSSNEGFGLPVLEAFSFGLPVIVSNQGALKEVAGDAALILEENISENLLRNMIKLIEDEHLRESLRKKGIMRLKEFTTEKFFLSLAQTFNDILDE
ncbi:glycosyltransferase [Belliella baltica DSM 15883]|uniref:Glycosyltransferase n=1 Tax=Belliella baltica (strain DSM 15883 / CIP 108006 / LMG 21964 / BA134) TaxID=866536 RepID=I3Z2V1_BELBD|nr:glycosyltransferase family 1 protein [Belliella baltica]AFL83569.1 glycosyltransferase [Belliella baltica DSM 15883]